MKVEFSKSGSASYNAILEAIRKRQTISNGTLKPASLGTVATDLNMTVRECRQALQRFRKKRPDYKREKQGSVTLENGEVLTWNAYSDPIEYAIIPAPPKPNNSTKKK